MALGRFRAQGSVAANATTAIVAAPGVRERIHVMKANLFASVAGTGTTAELQDSAGNTMMGLNTSTLGANAFQNWEAQNDKGGRVQGRECVENGALNLVTAGGAAATVKYDVEYEVRGG